MLEKIKDYLYDISDILIALVLVAVITIAITYKITDAFTIKIFNPIDDEQTAITEQIPEEETEVVVGENTPESQDPSEVTEPIEIEPATKVNFEVKRGMTGYNIANLVLEKGLIADINDFIQRVEELGLGNKLRSGTFSVSSNIPLDDLINVIAGK